MAQGYNKIYDECVSELSPEDQEDLKRRASFYKRNVANYEAAYNKSRPKDGVVRSYKMNLGDDGIKELIIMLIMEGRL